MNRRNRTLIVLLVAVGLASTATFLVYRAISRIPVRQVEVAVAKRGEDPQPGLAQLLTVDLPGVTVAAEVPLTWGVLGALDTIAEARRGGAPILAKFRTGGLAAELFPSPSDLAAVIVACHERGVPFKLTAGLHRAVRHNVLVGREPARQAAGARDVRFGDRDGAVGHARIPLSPTCLSRRSISRSSRVSALLRRACADMTAAACSRSILSLSSSMAGLASASSIACSKRSAIAAFRCFSAACTL